MKVTAYLRTSTESQEEGLQTQRAEIKRWAKANGHTITDWFTDEGKSGSNGLESRLGLAGALASHPEALVVYKLDRLARDLVIQETVLGQAKRQGTRVFSTLATEDAYLEDDPKDPTRKLIRQVLGAVADYDRAMIRLRMEAGANRKKAAGGYAGGGIPYGYRSQDGHLVRYPEEAKALALMKRLQGEGKSLREIARELDARGLAPRKGSTWHPYSVNRILSRAGSLEGRSRY
jgi:DNA invertase Pin-like site-specific DNA recombinase